ncbi:MBL fold metallo-hydrolase [Gimesia sp.]|uniref:MBL fold metallo-hydrolase n=1 Tax=Gimesia sp. TaxID=2024833 RepID=UPI003A90B180
MENTIFFERATHSIGQGAFFSGSVRVEHERFRYIYDCGSNDPQPLRYEIARYLESEQNENALDALFVSHFHKDHVQGLNQLLAGMQVESVIIPYLSPFERILLITEKAVENCLNYDEIQFISDPVEWLASRGVNRVIFVTTGGDESPPPADGMRTANDPQDKRGIRFSLKDIEEIETPVPAGNGRTQPVVYFLPHTTPLNLINTNSRMMNWEFLTFIHPDLERIEKFKDALIQVFPQFEYQDGRSISIRLDLLLPVLRNNIERGKLAGVYRNAFENLNYTTLCLYSGPAFNEATECCHLNILNKYAVARRSSVNPQSFHGLGHLGEYHHGRVGWIATGDAPLAVAIRREEFLNHYKDRFPFCSTMTTPHHGSKHNFDTSLCERGIAYFVATAREGNQHHPDPGVRRSVQQSGALFFLVTEEPLTELQEHGLVYGAYR